MSDAEDLRLIEDYLPIEEISAESSREKSVRKGHISTLHLWWARRPVIACRAAVYGALVPCDRWVREISLKQKPSDPAKRTALEQGKKKGLNRKAAKEFVTRLCRYPKTDPSKAADIKQKLDIDAALLEAQRHILEAHAERLSSELKECLACKEKPSWTAEFGFTGDEVTYDDIVAGRAPRPRIVDIFGGGGAIPLEALRLGCESYSLDLNPVAHIIQLCTLVYPQQFGQPNANSVGMVGKRNEAGKSTWGGLASELSYWGGWVLDRLRKEIGELYPPIPDPNVWTVPPKLLFDKTKGEWTVVSSGTATSAAVGTVQRSALSRQTALLQDEEEDCVEDDTEGNHFPAPPMPQGFLQPVAYLWTRTVRCRNPACNATVPLVRQTWLCQKKGRYVAAQPVPDQNGAVAFHIRESDTESGLGFDPAGFSSGGNATCFHCGTVADDDYVKAEGVSGRIGMQLMCAVAVRDGQAGKVYVSHQSFAYTPTPQRLVTALSDLRAHGLEPPDEPIVDDGKNSCWCTLYGVSTWGAVFTTRQNVALLTLCKIISDARTELSTTGLPSEVVKAIAVYLSLMVSRTANFCSTLCLWNYTGGRGVVHSFSHQAVPFTWDFPESNPLYRDAAGWWASVSAAVNVIHELPTKNPAHVFRGDCRVTVEDLPVVDAIVTDPPYYDNMSYADLADFFYVWLKRAAGSVLAEHFTAQGTPKKNEIVMDLARHAKDRARAKGWFESAMAEAFAKAGERLRPGGSLVCVYAHKTTLGWATLVDAMRRAGFVVTEAWPLATERAGGMKVDKAMLASSIFLIGRKRCDSALVGLYEDNVQPELQSIVRERVTTLWDMGIAGADLVIACVGAGLRAFTKHPKVEYANGEEVPAEKFLAEVEGVVLDAMMQRLLGQSGATVSAIDPASRFYVLWRFVYKAGEIEAGEAIVFTYAQRVELDGPKGVSVGKHALVEKKKSKYRARDYTERGDDEGLGRADEHGHAASLIDVLHRVLWLIDNSPKKLPAFLAEVTPDCERLRVLAQALAGAALSGKSEEDASRLVGTTPAEKAALGKLLANWRSLIEEYGDSKSAKEDRRRGQKLMNFE